MLGVGSVGNAALRKQTFVVRSCVRNATLYRKRLTISSRFKSSQKVIHKGLWKHSKSHLSNGIVSIKCSHVKEVSFRCTESGNVEDALLMYTVAQLFCSYLFASVQMLRLNICSKTTVSCFDCGTT